jgi:protein-L-isoaspartate(D-aspartate) O-methyltransferase
MTSVATLDEHRRTYAAEIASKAGLKTPGLEEAFATVPREAFLPPGPWLVVGEREQPRQTGGDDPRFVYEQVSVAIDPERQLFNGAPAFVARLIDALDLRPGARVLHVGAGLGYYSAIIGHVVGATGSVVAVEIDEALAARAQSNVAAMPWVTVECADGTDVVGPFDAILMHAGVTHPLDVWLDALAPGGRLLLPLTVEMPAMGATLGKGVVVIVSRTEDGADFRAAILSFVAIYSAIGLRDAEIGARLGQAMRRTSFPNLTRLRRDPHDSTPACWLHGQTFCLSMDPVS